MGTVISLFILGFFISADILLVFIINMGIVEQILKPGKVSIEGNSRLFAFFCLLME